MAVCAATNVEASNNAGVVLPRVESHDGVEGAELEAAVRDDSSDGHAKTSVEGKEALEASSRFIKQSNIPSKVRFPEQTSEARRVRA